MTWERWNQWTLAELPRLNRAVLAGGESPEALNSHLRRSVLAGLPAPETFSAEDACRVLVLLGLAGASVARHYQEADLSRKSRPRESFEQLPAGPDDVPFLEYFGALAKATGTGHVGRDCYASLVRWNAPTTEVRLDDETVTLLPGCFPDLSIRTYTEDPGEAAFFELLKKSEALEKAVNDTLAPVADGSVDILAPEAAERALAATRLMNALIGFNRAFATRPPGDGGLSTEHFMDVFRQFAVHWEPGDIPPTGAQDPEFLRRDFLLGIDFPDYGGLVNHVFPALLAEERAMLERHAARPPLPATLLAALDLDHNELAAAPPGRLYEILQRHRGLAAWSLLLAANAKFGAVHLMLTEKYLFKPQRGRDEAGIGDRELVSNRRGTTGMEEPLLVRLTRARKNHLLRDFGRIPAHELAAVGGLGSLEADPDRLPTVRFVAPAR